MTIEFFSENGETKMLIFPSTNIGQYMLTNPRSFTIPDNSSYSVKIGYSYRYELEIYLRLTQDIEKNVYEIMDWIRENNITRITIKDKEIGFEKSHKVGFLDNQEDKNVRSGKEKEVEIFIDYMSNLVRIKANLI